MQNIAWNSDVLNRAYSLILYRMQLNAVMYKILQLEGHPVVGHKSMKKICSETLRTDIGSQIKRKKIRQKMKGLASSQASSSYTGIISKHVLRTPHPVVFENVSKYLFLS